MQTFSTRWQQFTSKFHYHCFTPDNFCLVWNSGGWWLLRVVVYIFPWQFKDQFLLKGHIIPHKQHRMTLLTANWSHIHCCKLPFVLVLHLLIYVTSSVVLLLPQLGWRHKCVIVLVFYRKLCWKKHLVLTSSEVSQHFSTSQLGISLPALASLSEKA